MPELECKVNAVEFTPFSFDSPIAAGRTVLRPMIASDLDAVHGWMSDEDVVRYQLYEPRSREQVADRLAEYSQAVRLEKVDDYIQPAIVVDEIVVGLIYFKISSLDDLTGEIGWALAREHQGKGFAFEAASATLDLAFHGMGLHRVFAELDPRNESSIALCKRLGMREEAHLIENLMFKGDWADTGIYGILDREWLARS
jgi:RimJ/RimL family protein N-acetyltransferase